MATTPPEAPKRTSHWSRLPWASCLLLAYAQTAQAQTTAVQPSVAVTATAQRQENIPGTPSSGGRSSELVTLISPALRLKAKGRN